MKKCPYCAEKIQDTAVKCRYCGEWLTTPDLKHSVEIVNAVEAGKKVEKASIPLKELKLWNIVLYAVAIVASMFLVDFLVALFFGKLFDKIGLAPRLLIVLLLYCILGLAIADFSYKLRKIFLVLGIAVTAIFPVRFLMVVILFGLDNYSVRTAMDNTAIEAITVFMSTMAFILLFRFTELKFNFAEIRDIEKDIVDPETKKKYDMGVCGRCGTKMKIAKERFMGSTFGKSERHFCDNCGIFLRTNPFRAILVGLSEGILCFIFMVGMIATSKPEQTSTEHHNTYQSIFFLAMILGIFDGMKRLFAGIKGVIVSQSQQRYNNKPEL